MSDLPERLRAVAEWDPDRADLLREAADEVEHLRWDRANATGELGAARAEVERLRAAAYHSPGLLFVDLWRKASAEVERLREQLAEADENIALRLADVDHRSRYPVENAAIARHEARKGNDDE